MPDLDDTKVDGKIAPPDESLVEGQREITENLTPGEPTRKEKRWTRWTPGKNISNRYVVERRLGSGAMGEVYLARDRLLKKPVAIKVLRPDLAANRGTVRRFLREVALAQSVTHPSVVRIYDTGEADGLPYFTMEYLQGQRLDELILRDADEVGSHLSIREIRDICWEILLAMQAAHEAGVIHRDLKPSNVLLTHRGAIVMDFGVAGIDAAPEPVADASTASFESLVRTEAGTIFGSPAYMAPELWEGAPASVQSDLYAFGVMLYQMLTGRLPFDAPTPAAFLEKLRTEAPTPVRALRRDTPWTLALLVKRCMAMTSHRRPVSAAAASNLISPLRSRLRRRWVAGAAAVATVALAATFVRAAPTWTEYGLPDAVAEADLGAAVRSYDVGDRLSALRHLERLSARAPASAALAFWRATVHHDLGDEPGRREACVREDLEGSETWVGLARAACGPTYELAPPILASLTGGPGALGPEFLPLAVTESLVPRVEAVRSTPHPALEEATDVAERMGSEPEWSPLWALPVRWQAARVHLAIGRGDIPAAQELLAQLVKGHEAAPLVKELEAWLEMNLGNLDRAQELALDLLPDNPTSNIRLMMEDGELERAWQHVAALEGDPRHTALRTMWCGYAHRYELPLVPRRCSDLPPGFVRMMWAASPAGARDRAAMSPLELTVLRRQREVDMGECSPSYQTGPTLTHASPPFELYSTELEITAALCGGDPASADLKYARRVSQALVSVAPRDSWAQLIQAQVDAEMGGEPLARAKRLAVADRWKAADGDLPLVSRLRRRVGAVTITPPAAPRAPAPADTPAPVEESPVVAKTPEDE